MRDIEIRPARVTTIGVQGENKASRILFPIKHFVDDYDKSGTFYLLIKRPGDMHSYPCDISFDEDYVYWIPTSADTEKFGTAKVELRYLVDDTVAKATIYDVAIIRGIDEPSDVPEPYEPWVDKILSAADEITGFRTVVYSDIKKIDEYLYELSYNHLDYDYAYKYFESIKSGFYGGCSAVRKGNWYGRNFDWTYDNGVEFVIHTPRIGSRYASVGVMSGASAINKELVESGKYSDMYRVAPFMLVDGINEKGLVVNTNVVPLDNEPTTGTVPTVSTDLELCATMLPRYILDYFSSASEAANYIREHVSVYFSKTIHHMEYEAHYMIADSSSTYVIEFIDNEAVINDVTNKPFMTNFYLSGVVFNEDGTVYTPETKTSEYDAHKTNLITDHGSGLERYNLIVGEYNGIDDSKASMRTMMDMLTYTNSYKDSTTPFWYTEFVGGEIKVDSDVSEFSDAVLTAETYYANRSRDESADYYGTWQTTHSSIYDMDKKQLNIVVQEDGVEHTFYIDSSVPDELILNSSTEGSTKKFRITVNDSGELTAEEI